MTTVALNEEAVQDAAEACLHVTEKEAKARFRRHEQLGIHDGRGTAAGRSALAITMGLRVEARYDGDYRYDLLKNDMRTPLKREDALLLITASLTNGELS